MLKLLLGHEGPPQGAWRANLLTGQDFARCPRRTLQIAQRADPQTYRRIEAVALELYPLFHSHGTLPFAGGVLDQPARTMDELRLFAQLGKIAELKRKAIQKGNGGDDEGEA